MEDYLRSTPLKFSRKWFIFSDHNFFKYTNIFFSNGSSSKLMRRTEKILVNKYQSTIQPSLNNFLLCSFGKKKLCYEGCNGIAITQITFGAVELKVITEKLSTIQLKFETDN